jgi:hypothetical protein
MGEEGRNVEELPSEHLGLPFVVGSVGLHHLCHRGFILREIPHHVVIEDRAFGEGDHLLHGYSQLFIEMVAVYLMNIAFFQSGLDAILGYLAAEEKPVQRMIGGFCRKDSSLLRHPHLLLHGLALLGDIVDALNDKGNGLLFFGHFDRHAVTACRTPETFHEGISLGKWELVVDIIVVPYLTAYFALYFSHSSSPLLFSGFFPSHTFDNGTPNPFRPS